MNTIQCNAMPLNILLAEDDQDDRDFFEMVLKEIPISTCLTTVYDGEQLMNYLSENSKNLPDVLFLDLSMPHKNGLECLCEIKEHESLKAIPVVMYSTSFPQNQIYEEELINSLIKLGAHHYIRKPGDFVQLKEFIHQAIKRVAEKESFNEPDGNLGLMSS